MAPNLSPLSAAHLAHVERLFGAVRKLRLVRDASVQEALVASDAHLRDLERAVFIAKKASRARSLRIHRKSFTVRLALEKEWATAVEELLSPLLDHLDIVGAYHEAARGWTLPPPDPDHGMLVGYIGPGGAVVRAVRKRFSKPRKGDLQTIEEWGGARAELAREAIESGHAVVVRDTRGKPVAVAETYTEHGEVVVRRLSAAPGGTYGREMLQELARRASREKAGLRVQATTKEQVDYFARLGMRAAPGAEGAQPAMSMTAQLAAQFALSGGAVPPTLTGLQAALASGVNETAWKSGAYSRYVGLALQTAEQAGQASLEHLGIHKTFEFASPRNMAQDLYQARGSKIVQNLYGEHMKKLSKIIAEATNPKTPLTIQQTTARIREEWPKLTRYQAERIARTETAIVWTATSANAYEANGIGEFESIVATGPSIGIESEAPCEICEEAALRVHDITDDLPPWHPSCRCEAIPVLEDEDGTPWLPPDEPWTGGADGAAGAVGFKQTPLPPPSEPVPPGILHPEPPTPPDPVPPSSSPLPEPKPEPMPAPAPEPAPLSEPEPVPPPTPPKPKPITPRSPVPAPRPVVPTEDVPITDGPATEALDRAFSKWGTSPAEREALQAYRNEHGSEAIQGALRDGRITDGQAGTAKITVREAITRIDTLLRGVPEAPVSLDMTVFRGVNSRMFGPGGPRVGDIVTEPAYTSTTTERRVAEKYADLAAGHVSETSTTLMEVTIPKGVRGVWMRGVSEEFDSGNYEFLLARGARFKITDVKTEKLYPDVSVSPTKTYVQAELLPPEAVPRPPLEVEVKPTPGFEVPRFTSVEEAQQWAVANLADEVDLATVTQLDGLHEMMDGIGSVLGPHSVRLDRILIAKPRGRALAVYGRGTYRLKVEGKNAYFRGTRIQAQKQITNIKAMLKKNVDQNATLEANHAISREQYRRWAADETRPAPLRESAERKLKELEAAKRWIVAHSSDQPVKALFAHEAGHALADAYGLLPKFTERLKALGATRLDYLALSEYAATSISEVWAEAIAARAVGVDMPKVIAQALDETLATIPESVPRLGVAPLEDERQIALSLPHRPSGLSESHAAILARHAFSTFRALEPTILDQGSRVAQAVTETITSPGPGLGHGKAADAAAWLTLLLTSVVKERGRDES